MDILYSYCYLLRQPLQTTNYTCKISGSLSSSLLNCSCGFSPCLENCNYHLCEPKSLPLCTTTSYNHCLSAQIVLHKPVNQEQIVGAQNWHKWNLHTLYQIATSSGTNCFGHKLYHCINYKLFQAHTVQQYNLYQGINCMGQ